MNWKLAVLFHAIGLFAHFDVSTSSKWSYKGDTGPNHWHELFPKACSGNLQSPININPEETIYNPKLKDFAIWYDPPRDNARMYVKNNGHAVQVDTRGDFFVTNAGLPHLYKTAQFHFHWGHKDHHGSEHHIEGQPHPLELHIVNFNNDNFGSLSEAATEPEGLAVLGVLFDITDEDNKVLDPIIRAMAKVRDPDEENLVEIKAISLRDILPDDISRYFRYNGSLTTPGCFQSVVWTVFEQRQTISLDQLLQFRKILKPKHQHHHKKQHRHMRRSTAEKNAEHVIDELGIRGNHMEEGELKSKMLEMKMELAEEAPVAKTTMMPSLDEESAKRAENNMVRHANEKKSEAEHAEKTHGKMSTTRQVEEVVYIQDHLVNNFRPIQPINGRQIQRSFKLGVVVIKEETKIEPVYTIGQSQSQNNRGNSASQKQYSFTMLILTLLVYIWQKV